MSRASCLLGLALLPACVSYAPPVRSPTYGAPGRLRQGDLEIAGSVAGVVAPGDAGGGWLAYGVRDWASVELGVDASLRGWAMGFLGGRFTHAPSASASSTAPSTARSASAWAPAATTRIAS
jgi:hypothetical protein